MKLEIKKLDRRNTGYNYFKYSVFVYANYLLYKNRVVDNYYFEIREWCWQTWGSSKELDEWLDDKYFIMSNIVMNKPPIDTKCQNEHWCWKHQRDAKHRIYLRDDTDLVLFKLRWE